MRLAPLPADLDRTPAPTHVAERRGAWRGVGRLRRAGDVAQVLSVAMALSLALVVACMGAAQTLARANERDAAAHKAASLTMASRP